MSTDNARRTDLALRKRLELLVSALLLLTLTGCPYVVAGGAAATGVLYYKGELRAQLEAPPDDVMAATQKAFDYFKWSTVEVKASRTDGIAKAKTAADKEVSVSVEAQMSRVSVIAIRVGVFGDETVSQLLFEKIKENLGIGVKKI